MLGDNSCFPESGHVQVIETIVIGQEVELGLQKQPIMEELRLRIQC